VTLIDYEGALKLGDVTDSLLRSAGLPDLSLHEMPERASNRSAFGLVHETFGDELLRQAFKYIYDYALEEKNLSLVGGRTNDLNFNNLTIAKYSEELPTSKINLTDLADQAPYLLPTTYHLPPTTYHLPPTTYCPLPTAHCPLPTAHCPLAADFYP
jgi:hypothetical protein